MASAAGLLAPIPALSLMGIELPLWALFLWAIAVAFLGVMFAVPLRNQYVITEKLKFPSGLATADTIKALYASGSDALVKAKYLGYFAAIGFLYTIISNQYSVLESPPIDQWLGSATLVALAAWGFKLYISPALFSAGFLIGPRVGISLLLGAIVGWSLAYYAKTNGWAPHENHMIIFDNETGTWGAKGWILWTGVSIMVSEALTGLLLSYKTIINSFKGLSSILEKNTKQDDQSIPTKWWVGGLILASTLTIFIAYSFFNIPPYLTIISIILSFILANVAVRSVGETDINPVGGVGKVTQVVFGSLSSSIQSNLMAAGITGGGASQAADMMQDFKTGYIFGASPKNQFKAQLWGILSGIFFAILAYYLFTEAYGIGSEKLPAPAAESWKAVALVMSKGLKVLPPVTGYGVFYGSLLGIFLAIANKLFPKTSQYLPSGLAFGISFIVSAQYSIIMFLGTMVWLIWRYVNKESCENLAFPIACGVLAGDGIANMVNAVLTMI